MNQLELEYARKRKNKTKADMAAAIGKSVVSYAKKERGDVKFSDEEKIIVAILYSEGWGDGDDGASLVCKQELPRRLSI